MHSFTFRVMYGKCRVCKEDILGSHITTTAHKYHQDCFVCDHCLQPFNSSQFYETQGSYYCLADFQLLHAFIAFNLVLVARNADWLLTESILAPWIPNSILSTLIARSVDIPWSIRALCAEMTLLVARPVPLNAFNQRTWMFASSATLQWQNILFLKDRNSIHITFCVISARLSWLARPRNTKASCIATRITKN